MNLQDVFEEARKTQPEGLISVGSMKAAAERIKGAPVSTQELDELLRSSDMQRKTLDTFEIRE